MFLNLQDKMKIFDIYQKWVILNFHFHVWCQNLFVSSNIKIKILLLCWKCWFITFFLYCISILKCVLLFANCSCINEEWLEFFCYLFQLVCVKFFLDNLLSERAIISRDKEDFLTKYLEVCNSDPYDEKDNPSVCTMNSFFYYFSY